MNKHCDNCANFVCYENTERYCDWCEEEFCDSCIYEHEEDCTFREYGAYELGG